jgi:hypothetical protein
MSKIMVGEDRGKGRAVGAPVFGGDGVPRGHSGSSRIAGSYLRRRPRGNLGLYLWLLREVNAFR